MRRGRDPKPRGESPPKASVPPASGANQIPKLWEDEPEPSRTAPTDFAPRPSGFARKDGEPRGKRALLLVMNGTAAGRVLLIESRKVTVGRSRQADFTLGDDGVSRMHCGIASNGDTYELTDLGSTHGTFVNGARIERVALAAGDRIQLGTDALLEFDVCDAAEQGVLDKLYEGATRDLLTRALNRRAFEERLTADVSYALRHRAGLCAVAVEIDDLDAIAEAHGNAGGDAVLREVAGAIASMLRRDDVLARTRTNGFVVLGRGLSLQNGITFAERIRKLVEEQSIAVEGTSVRVTITAGIAELGECEMPASGSALLELADARLVAARASGPNRIDGKS